LLAKPLQAQVSIGPAELPQANDTLVFQQFTIDSLAPGPAGADVNWDFSAIDSAAQGGDSLMILQDPDTAQGGNAFPQARFAREEVLRLQVGFLLTFQQTRFYAVNNSAYIAQGLHQDSLDLSQSLGFPVRIKEQTRKPSQPDTVMPLPFGIGDTASYGPLVEFVNGEFGMDSIRLKRKKTRLVIADAWGSLTLPDSNTIDTVLRIKSYVVSDDTALIYDSTQNDYVQIPQLFPIRTADTTYRYYAPGEGLVMELQKFRQYDPNGVNGSNTLYRAMYRSTGQANDTDTTSSITEAAPTQNGAKLGPNPVRKQLRIQLPHPSKRAQLSLYNTRGQLVRRCDIAGHARISVQRLPAGVYSYQLQGDQLHQHGRLLIQD
jgi:hypothetical protein